MRPHQYALTPAGLAEAIELILAEHYQGEPIDVGWLEDIAACLRAMSLEAGQ